jgi:general secretion pathway protein L
MRTLIIQLPAGLPSPSLAYAHAEVAQAQTASASHAMRVQWAAANLLPRADRQTETVALVPAGALSWHRVDLPPGLHKQTARLPAALQGVLEDRLLDDTADLHMALQADWPHTARPWVAVCDRAWLSAHLQTLEQAGLTVHRIVPELSPGTASSPPQITALGDAETGWLWVSHPERGVWALPLSGIAGHTAYTPTPGAAALHAQGVLGLTAEELDNAMLQAEPGAVALVGDITGQQVRLMPPAQHWWAAVSADWDLAQFGLRANARTRQLKNWQRHASNLWHSPDWRPARWGLWLLLASHLLGLNAWAWKTRADWQAQQNSWAQVLRETFPQTSLVVDAPLQMAQQVDRLRQGSGQLRAEDLESMLSALGQSMPAALAAPGQWTYQTGQLRLQGFRPDDAQQQALQQSLRQLGYQWRAQGDAWLMSASADNRDGVSTPATGALR